MFGESHIFLWTALAAATLLPLLTTMSGSILLISVDLWLPSSLFPFLPPQMETRPWLYPTPTAHLQLFWCQLAAVSSSVCIHSSFSRVRTSGKYQSLVEAAFPGHQPIWSPQQHVDIIPHPLLVLSGSPGNIPVHCSPNRARAHPGHQRGPLLLFWGQIHQVEWCFCLWSSASHPLAWLTALLPISKGLWF